MSRSAFVLLLLTLALWPAEAFSQALRATDLVTWRVRAESAAPGGNANIYLDATIEDGWRLYAMDSPVGRPLELTMDTLPDGLAVGDVVQDDPETGYDQGFEMEYPYFAGSARVAQILRVSRGMQAGRHTVRGRVSFTVCNDSVCLPPARVPFRVPVVIASR
ncbi:MAG: protein-disulfide reductase DsbD domain-containing protein [Bacteroidota bacterium]